MRFWPCGNNLQSDGLDMKTVCYVCRKDRGSDGGKGKEVGLFKSNVLGVCPDCYAGALERIKANYAWEVNCENMLFSQEDRSLTLALNR